MDIKKVGVVGCGIMGAGIVQVCAESGYEVVVSETNKALLDKGLASINAALTRRVDKGKISQGDKDTVLGRIKGTTDIGDFSDRDLMIEAVVEDLDLKKKIFAELDEICPKHAILSTNTSCLSVADMAAAAASRPEKVLGLHFFNPVPVMKLLELVKTIAASEETIRIGKEFGESLGKTVVVAPDTPGFIASRVSSTEVLNAIRLLEAGLATREDIDTAISLGMNRPMGPLQLADFIGLDTIYYAAVSKFEELKDFQYAPPLLLKKMVTMGWLGRKSGKGFYEYKTD